MFGGMTGTESKWMERVGDWKRSGQSAKEFAESQPYQPSSLIWWERRLRSRLVAAKSPTRKGENLRSRDSSATLSVPMARVMRSAAAQSDANVELNISCGLAWTSHWFWPDRKRKAQFR
jgi:hypothetical protein